MLHKCANPTCINPFRKLSEGKLFLVEIDGSLAGGQLPANWDGKTSRRIEHFWLCDQCAPVLTLSFEKGRGMVTVPLPEAVKRGPASMGVGDANRTLVREEGPLLKRA